MNRLINADELLARAEHEANGMTGDFKDLLVPTLSWLINKTSTAYDVDKVIEELVKSAKESHGNAGMGGEMVVNLDDAVEIVKQGGVADNVCEWKQLVAEPEELKAYRETGQTPQMVNDIVKSAKQAHKDAVHNALLVDETYNKVKQASDLLENAVEEIENIYGRETDLTERIRLFIDKERESE